jgi:23S rRNA (cytidine1920-2'-O)/16S rRNA (cytidine1409-2'-O)-methyltransferase
MTQRLDKHLVGLGLCETRNQAQELIKEKVVYVDGKLIDKPSYKTESQNIKIEKEQLFVGRGAHKVEGAFAKFNINPSDMVIADVGACTGGFTDYAFSRGAVKSYAIDVGHGQLAKKLIEDSRVINMEGNNVRDLSELPEKVDLAVVDLSFISLKLVLKNIFNYVTDDGEIVALVKPQFEVGRDNIGKNGIVKSKGIVLNTILSLYTWCSENGFFISDFCLSPITGKTGNTEYFFHFDKKLTSHKLEEEKLISIIKGE